MARILVIAPDLPHPPFTGAHTRPLSLIRALARHHEVVVVGSAAPGAELAPLEDLCLAVGRLRAEPYRRGAARTALAGARKALTPVPLIGRSWSAPLARLVDDAVRRFRPDAMQVETMYAAHYRRSGMPAVIDLPDVVSGLCEAAAAAHPLRYAAAGQQRRAVERQEREMLAAFAAILTITTSDAARLLALGLTSVHVPLAITPPPDEDLAPGRSGSPVARPLRVLFVASFAHLPNRAAAAFLLDRVVTALAGRALACELTLAGRRAAEWAATARAAGSAVGGFGSVKVDFISDPPDLAPLYRRADVVVAPLAFGGGTKNKTLEAMAWGLPVVGTPQAFTGLPENLRGVAWLETPLDADVLARTLARLAADSALRERLGRAGRAYVLAEHTQAHVDALMDAVYERVLGAAAGAAGGPA